MRGFTVFLAKEMREIVRTWRIWVVPAIMVFIGLSSPILAKITPDLVKSLASSEQTGLVIQIPDPVTADAYLQFSKNALQMALIAVIISVAGMVAAEKRSGTAVLVLTKPVSRTALVVAKVISNLVLVVGSTVVGALLSVLTTWALFDRTLVLEFAASVGLFLALAGMFVACMAALSTIIGSQGGAAGAGMGLYLAVSLLSAWGPGREYTPAGLLSAGDRIVMGQDPSLLWPLLSTAAVFAFAVMLAAWVFERQEI